MAECANEALFTASMDGSLAGVKAALEAGADINSDQPGTALVNAAYMGHMDILELLLRKGASVVQRVRTSYSPLHAAAISGKADVVAVLVRHGATVDIRDGFQMTPIMHACFHGHVDVVRRLIEFGARVDLIEINNMSILQVLNTKTGMAELDAEREDCMKLVQEALQKKQLRCCNPECGKPGYRSTLKKCARCRLTRYCSKDCQKQHWSAGHKKCCGHDGFSGPAPNHWPQIMYILNVLGPMYGKS